MIDLRKPLEGVPGLLLMAALVLFGATIGISFALGFSWLEMKDSLANFLGGVVGAGLGAALAVLGAVFVQRRDARDRLRAPINRLYLVVFELDMLAGSLVSYLDGFGFGQPDSVERFRAILQAYGRMVDAIESLPEGAELPSQVHHQVQNVRRHVPKMLRPIRTHMMAGPPKGQTPEALAEALRKARAAASVVGHLYKMVDELREV